MHTAMQCSAVQCSAVQCKARRQCSCRLPPLTQQIKEKYFYNDYDNDNKDNDDNDNDDDYGDCVKNATGNNNVKIYCKIC